MTLESIRDEVIEESPAVITIDRKRNPRFFYQFSS